MFVFFSFIRKVIISVSTWGCCFPAAPQSPCVAHWSPLILSFIPLYISGLEPRTAVREVSTVSFPLQRQRMRRCACKDRSLEWTYRPPRGDDRSCLFTPLWSSCRLWCCVYFPVWEPKSGWKRAVCAYLLEKSGDKMAQRQDVNFVVLHFRGFNSFPLTYKHDI